MDTQFAQRQTSNRSELIAASQRRVLDYAGLVARGFCMGAADVVPGVSGGTMAFILGIYEELINSIRAVARSTFLHALSRLQIGAALRAINFLFLVSVLLGIALAVVTLAPGIEWMLVNQPVLIWSFFFGLVLASVFTVAKRIQYWHLSRWVSLAVGTIGAFLIVGLVPVQTPETWWFLFLSGAIAICAMILPGISGSFILLLLGKYQFLMSAVNNRDIVVLLVTGMGAAVGLVTFAQILGWLFRRYHDVTVALLTGFMLGSLRKVWPWKEVLASTVDRHGAEIPIVERNVLPALYADQVFNVEIVYALIFGIVGLIAVVMLDRLSLSSHQAPH